MSDSTVNHFIFKSIKIFFEHTATNWFQNGRLALSLKQSILFTFLDAYNHVPAKDHVAVCISGHSLFPSNTSVQRMLDENVLGTFLRKVFLTYSEHQGGCSWNVFTNRNPANTFVEHFQKVPLRLGHLQPSQNVFHNVS